MRYSNEFKLQCIEMYYQGKYPETPDGISATHFHDLIREWVRISERSSLNAVQHKAQSKKWTPEEKLELIEKVLAGGACRAVAEKAGMTHSVLYQWVRKYKMEGYKGLLPKKKGRPPKDYVVSEEAKVAELRYMLARKDAKIKSLEMENELMRDFLSLTERK